MRSDAAIVTDPKGKAVHELNAGGLALAPLQVSTKGKPCHRNPFDKPGVAVQTGKLGSLARQQRNKIEMLKGAIVRSVKPYQDRHDLAQTQAVRATWMWGRAGRQCWQSFRE